MVLSTLEREQLSKSQIGDLRLASTKLSGAKRRSLQAEMCLKYCDGSARFAETVVGWNRVTVELGLAEQRSGITCIGAQANASGTKQWEERHPEVAQALRELAESQVQQDPTFSSSIAYTRLTAAEALKQVEHRGFAAKQLPSNSTMAAVLNRMGYRLRKVVKRNPKKLPETDAIFDNLHRQSEGLNDGSLRRLSMDCHRDRQSWRLGVRWQN